MTVKEIMTTNIISVHPETPIIEVAELLTKHQFNGVPVVDASNGLVGILTEYNLISGASGVHLPTLQKVLSEIPVFNKDKRTFSKDIGEVMQLTAKDIMNNDPLTLPVTATYEETVKAFQTHHAINPIPVVDSQRKLVGVVSRFDVIKPVLPQ